MSNELIAKLKSSNGLKTKQGWIYWEIKPVEEGLWSLGSYIFSQRSNSLRLVFGWSGLSCEDLRGLDVIEKTPVEDWEEIDVSKTD